MIIGIATNSTTHRIGRVVPPGALQPEPLLPHEQNASKDSGHPYIASASGPQEQEQRIVVENPGHLYAASAIATPEQRIVFEDPVHPDTASGSAPPPEPTIPLDDLSHTDTSRINVFYFNDPESEASSLRHLAPGGRW